MADDGLRKGLTSYGDAGFSLFLRKAFIKAMGYSDDALNRPIVGITNTYSDYNPCHGNVPQIIEAVKRGVMLAGAMPMVFPTISIAESFCASDLDVSAQPDGDGYRGDDPRPADGRDRRDRRLRQDPAGADHGRASAPICRPSSFRSGRWWSAITRARCSAPAPIAAGCGRKYRAGEIDDVEIEAVNGRLAPSVGTCMVMGTASTMACITEALGLSLPMSATIPAPHAERFRSAEASGRVAAAMAKAKGPKPSEFLDGGVVPQCAGRAAGDRRLDQRLDPSHRDRPPHQAPDRSRRIRQARPRGAGAGRPETVGRALHGAFPSCRRRAETDGAARRSHRSRCEDDHRRDACAKLSPVRRRCRARMRSARATIRSSRKARWRCCTAISRRAAP